MATTIGELVSASSFKATTIGVSVTDGGSLTS